MKSASKTDIGRIRSVNEDRVVVQDGLDVFSLAIVADGMGGHRAGDIASQMAIEHIQAELQDIHREMSAGELEKAMRKAILSANRAIFEFASRQETYHGMGTTVVAAIASEQTLVIGHIGDSRAYLIDGEHISQLTEDHSLVNELLRSGQITREEAEHHPRRNVLTRALGTEPGAQIDVRLLEWKQGDILLMCSDGLSGSVGSAELLRIVSSGQELERLANSLVDCALQAGGDDNISVVLLGNEPNNKEMG